MTPNIKPPTSLIKEAIEHSGGEVRNHRRLTIPQIKERNPYGKDPNYIVLTCELDLYLVEDVMKAKVPVYTSEFVLEAILQGFMDFDMSRYINTIWILFMAKPVIILKEENEMQMIE